ncbi:MAG TPA: DUF4112 domain-containing protein [Longimicrobiales bacterium]|nr:DUF4112 domain-containing protein [Longimicrobiales bacterium]
MDDRTRARDVERLARLLDDVVTIPGTRIRVGLDPLLGLLPGGGDLIGGALSAWIIVAAARLGAPPAVIARMGANVLVDTAVGAVPVLGDIFDIVWRANRRNVDLLGSYLDSPGPVHRSSRAVVGAVLLVLLAALVGALFIGVVLVRWLIGLF